MSNLLKKLARFFKFSTHEVKGVALLLLLIISIFVLPKVYEYFEDNESTPTLATNELGNLQQKLEQKSKAQKKAYANTDHKDAENIDHFESNVKTVSLRISKNFDPNIISVQEMIAFGMPRFLAERIEKYRSKGGKFKQKEDLAKIYDMDAALYQQLEPFIELPENVTVTKFESKENIAKAKTIERFDINKADTTQLITLKGIASKRAQYIINYREKLGGFFDINQIKEVRGLDSVAVDEILKYSYVQSPVLKKIAINQTDDFKHLYLKPWVAKAIVAYRKEHGNFKEIEELKKVKLIDEKTYNNIKPYISLE